MSHEICFIDIKAAMSPDSLFLWLMSKVYSTDKAVFSFFQSRKTNVYKIRSEWEYFRNLLAYFSYI